jgi:hypothetical protein
MTERSLLSHTGGELSRALAEQCLGVIGTLRGRLTEKDYERLAESLLAHAVEWANAEFDLHLTGNRWPQFVVIGRDSSRTLPTLASGPFGSEQAAEEFRNLLNDTTTGIYTVLPLHTPKEAGADA